MYIPDKTYTENPFMDNVIYYTKLMSMNATIKDINEALKYETKDSLYDADVLIACVEGRAQYEMFKRIPIEILENYIPIKTNLDIYAKDPQWLKNHMDSYLPAKRNAILDRLSRLARTTYIDHYDIMVDYVKSLGTSWLVDHEDLYWKCKRGTATYIDLFDELPTKTSLRIIRAYLNSHGYIDLAILWDPESSVTKADLAAIEAASKSSISSNDSYEANSKKALLLDTEYVASISGYSENNSTNKNQFIAYISTRDDDNILTELANISKAMRDVFASHYEIMKERAYFGYKSTEEGIETLQNPAWMGYTYDLNAYNQCKANTAKWFNLWPLFPDYAIRNALNYVFGEDIVNEYNLTISVDAVETYLSEYATGTTAKRVALNEYMINDYLNNYQLYLNKSVYDLCKAGNIDIYSLYEYLPPETIKSILSTEIAITTNLDAYSKSKVMLNAYLESIDSTTAQSIRDSITADMTIWYPKNHVETNNYYRAFMGLPPLDDSGVPYIDTLEHTWLEKSGEFLEFGNIYVGMCPTNTYSVSHWKNTELYKFDMFDINTLNDNSILNAWLTNAQPNGCGGNMNSLRYRYLKYLGDAKLDIYKCRKAANFELLDLPSTDDQDIYNKFIDTYAVNRDYIIKCVYDDAYNFQSDYYDKFMIIFIVINTILDVCSSIPDYIIHREVFDARCIKFLFESMGIPYYDEIPLKYQQRMLKNLNILIKYKSSTKNMIDICNLFGFSDINVYEYYLIKHRNIDSNGEYIPNDKSPITYSLDDVYIKYKYGDITDISGNKFCKLSKYPSYQSSYYTKTISVMKDDGTVTEKQIVDITRPDLYVYDETLGEMITIEAATYFATISANTAPAELRFIKVPIDDNLNNYKSDKDYIASYDEVTQEETWDGGLDHEAIKQKILDYGFNAVKSKYIGIESVTDLTDMAFQTSYFYNMLLDNHYLEDLLKINIEFIKPGHVFRLTDVILFMFAMTYYYMGLKDKILFSPTQILCVKGYSFSDAVSQALNDERYFAQTTPSGSPLSDNKKYDVFDVNKQISERNYDYQELFARCGIRMKAFNLNIDIDALEDWLNKEWQMSLSDFIVSEDIETFGQIVTLMSFYSLKNSYYQKNITSGNMRPIQYNNILKYAYEYNTIAKTYIDDISETSHCYLPETIISEITNNSYGYLTDIVALVSKSYGRYTYNELIDKVKRLHDYDKLSNYAYILKNILAIEDINIINDLETKIETKFYNLILEPSDLSNIMVLNNQVYAVRYAGTDYEERLAIYNEYTKSGNDYVLAHDQYYTYNESKNTYNILISGYVYVRNADGIFTFATDAVYITNKVGNMIEIDYDRFSVYDSEINARVLNFGDYYILNDEGKYILNPDNCYIYGEIDGIWQYVLLSEIEEYTAKYADTDECYIRTDEGYYMQFKYTDFYDRTHNNYESGNEMVYKEKPLYIRVDTETEYEDPDRPGVYYRLLSEYYNDDNFLVSTDVLYVKDSYGNYIREEDLLIPANTWFLDEHDGQYHLVVDNQFDYVEYSDPLDVLYLLVKQTNYDYYKYAYESATKQYKYVDSTTYRYVTNSNSEYITLLNNDSAYSDSKSLIVVFNYEYTEDTDLTENDNTTYNPSLNDGVWDENDWYYDSASTDPDNAFEMNSENKWYYKNSDVVTTPETVDNIMGSGFYFESSSFIGVLELEKGVEYYLSMDMLCNFNGEIQVYCTYDNTVTSLQDNLYSVTKGETLHINQSFIAKTTGKPQIRILKHGFDNNPIYIGDYVVISKLTISKAYSENYIPTDLPSIDTLAKIYKTNTAIYKWLLTQLHNTEDKRMYDIYKKLYDSLMISDYNREVFKLPSGEYATTFTDFLKNRDNVLYEILISLSNMDIETMKTTISNYIIEICYVLQDYLSDLDLDYIYAYFPGISISFVQEYLLKVINWFKSWKVQMLGINTLYRLGHGATIDANGELVADKDGDQFMIKFLHDELYKIKKNIYLKDTFMKDTLKINPLDGISPDGTPYVDKYDMNDHNSISDSIWMGHRIRIMVDNGNSLEYLDNESNMRLNLNADSSNVSIRDGHILEITTINGDKFEVSDKNRLILNTDEDPEDVFTAQIIDEINLMSSDYITDHDITYDLDELD